MTTISGGASRVTTPTTAPTDAPDVAADTGDTKPADTGFANGSSFTKVSTKLNDTKDLLRHTTSLSTNVDKLVGNIFQPGATGAAKAQSASLGSTLGAAVGLAQDARNLIQTGVKLTKGDDAAGAVADKTKGADKALGVAGNVSTLVSDHASVVDRLNAGVNLARDANGLIKDTTLGQKLTQGLEAGGKLLGGAAGVVGVVNNGAHAVEDFKKLAHGDVKAGLEGIRDTVATANSALTAVESTAKGAQLLKVGGEVAEGALNLVAKAGPLTKALPMVGAAIGTAKATYDFAKNPSLLNGAKVVANAVGFIPGVGTAVSVIATTALDHPDLVAKGAAAVGNAASKAWNWVTGG